MNSFDQTIISFFGGFTGKCWQVDFALFSLSDNDLLKGGIFMLILWALWFRSDSLPVRNTLICTLAGAMVAIFVSKILEHSLPMRPRPYQLQSPGAHFPYDMGMEDYTSFPSDHAALFFSLSMGFCFSNRKIGIIAFLYSLIVICCPRIYLGLHYPSDILGGALIGILCALISQRGKIKNLCGLPVVAFAEKYPGIFYPVFFLVTFEMATLFDGLRDIGRILKIISMGHS